MGFNGSNYLYNNNPPRHLPKPTSSGTLGDNQPEQTHPANSQPYYNIPVNNDINGYYYSNIALKNNNNLYMHNNQQQYHQQSHQIFSNNLPYQQYMMTNWNQQHVQPQHVQPNENNNLNQIQSNDTIQDYVPNLAPTVSIKDSFHSNVNVNNNIKSSFIGNSEVNDHMEKKRIYSQMNSDHFEKEMNQNKAELSSSSSESESDSSSESDSEIESGSESKSPKPSEIHSTKSEVKSITKSTITTKPTIESDDEEKPKLAVVAGTSITLVTEEDITKWREERKKMWLLKISNNKKKYMEEMGIKEDELRETKSVLQESKKQKQFINSIQSQVTRMNPKANLNIKIIQREMAKDNMKLIQFIKELGDAHLLDYELNEEEKEALFGITETGLSNMRRPNQKNNRKPFQRNQNSGNNFKRRPNCD